MSQAVITKVFSEWKAQQAINNQPVTLDEFIFAYIPGLDDDKPIDNTETMPAADKIVDRQAVSKTGVVNENSVVYSVTLGADVGDYDFNWIGLANKATGTLAMIIHAPTQRKIKNANGQQGNVLVRSMLMEYSGAREATEITTPAETWQIDFTARLSAMDERQRRENIDLYGAAAFFDSGYLVAKTGNQFFVTKGAGYVAGLRAELPADLNISASERPAKVWLDVSWTGTLTSEWAVQSKITVAADLADYVLGGVQHYVFAVASIDVAGNITDLRPKGSLNDQTASDALKKHEQSRNHPDATTSAKGFTQLSSATDSTSEELAATSKAVKIAMDNANVRLAKDRNGSDIPNPPLFVQNIGLQDTVNKAAGALQKDQNGADVPDKDLFVRNVGAARAFSGSVSIGESSEPWTTAEFIVWLESQGAFNHPYWMCKGSWTYAGNRVITDTGCGNISLAGSVVEVMGVRGAMTIRVTTPTTTMGDGIPSVQFTYINHGDGYLPGWRRDLKRSGDEMTGKLTLPQTSSFGVNTDNAMGGSSIAIGDNDTGFRSNSDGNIALVANGVMAGYFTADELRHNKKILTKVFEALAADNWSEGAGAFANQLNSNAPFNIPVIVRPENDNSYFPVIKQKISLTTGWPAAFSMGMMTAGAPQFPQIAINAMTDSAEKNRLWLFDIESGNISSPGTVNAGGGSLYTDGNIGGPLWGGTLSNWLYNNIGVRDTRYGAESFYYPGGNRLSWIFRAPSGHMLSGISVEETGSNSADNIGGVYYRPLQKLVNGTWYNVESV